MLKSYLFISEDGEEKLIKFRQTLLQSPTLMHRIFLEKAEDYLSGHAFNEYARILVKDEAANLLFETKILNRAYSL